MPLYFPRSCTSSFLFHIGTIRSIIHSLSTLPSCIHTFSSLPVHFTPTSPAISNISSCTSSAPVALFFFHSVHCCIHFFLSNLLHFHLSPNRAWELVANCCSVSVQQLIIDVWRSYPQHFLSEEEEEHEFIWLHNKKIYNSGYSTEIVNEQCNTGDPLETSGGLYRGPPSMLIYVNTIKCCARETLNLVQCSITMNVKLLQ